MQNVLQPVLCPQPRLAGSSGPSGNSSGPSCLGYTMWEFDGQQWQVKKVSAYQGAVTSEPPAIPGRFKGQLRATACVAV
jgi:hypothetical protein